MKIVGFLFLMFCSNANATEFSDDFNRSDTSFGDLGSSNWTVSAPAVEICPFYISGNAACITDIPNSSCGKETAYWNKMGTLNSGTGRFSMSVDMNLDNTASTQWAGLMFNYSNPSNYYAFRYSGAGGVQLVAVVNGSVYASPLNLSAGTFTHDNSRFYRLEVSSNDPYEFDASITDVSSGTVVWEQCDIIDTNQRFMNGYGGLFTATPADVTFDNFHLSVWDVVSIELEPGMEEISSISPSAPLSYTSSKEECDVQCGLNLYSDIEYDWITSPGSSITLTVDCDVNEDPYTVRALFWDYMGRVVHVEELGAAPVMVPMTVSISGTGVYMITLDAISSNGTWKSRLVRTVSALPDNSELIDCWRNTNDYIIGSCFFPHRINLWTKYTYPDMTADEAIERIASMAEFVGFQALRIDYKSDTDPFNTSRTDEIVSILTNHNQKINFKVRAKAENAVNETALSEWTGNVVDYVQRYQDSAWLFEIGNEPAHSNFFDADWDVYLDLLSNAYVNVKAEVPSALITHGALCPWEQSETGTTRGYEWYENFIEHGAQYNDLVAYHFHGTLTNTEGQAWIPEYKSMYLAAGCEDISWVQTEGGVCLWRAVEDISHTPHLLQKIFWSWASGDRGWMQFSLFADVSSSWANSESFNWSIFDEQTFCAKMPVGQISAMINYFAGYTAGEIIFENELLLLMKFSELDGRVSLVGFSKDENTYSGTIGFDGASAALYDPQGNLLNVSTNGIIDVAFSAYPCWVETAGDIYPLVLEDVDAAVVTDVSFEQVLFGTSEGGTNELSCDLDDSMYNLDSVIDPHNFNVSIKDGVAGNGLYIDGPWGGYAEVDLSALGLSLSELTVSLWTKINRYADDYEDGKAFWSIEADDGGNISLLTGVGSGRPCLQNFDGGINGVPSFEGPWGLANQWKMITVVFSESNGTVRLYYDESNPLTVQSYDPDLTQTLNRFRIGNRFNAEQNALKGYFDEVKIYNRALSAEEISALYSEYSQ